MLRLLHFDPLLHLLQCVSPVPLLGSVAGGSRRRPPLVRPRRDPVGLEDGAGRGHQAVPRADAGGQRGGGSRHGRRGRRVVELREGGGHVVGGEGRVRVHLQDCGARGVLHCGGILVEAAALAGGVVPGLQEDLVDPGSRGVGARGLVVVAVVHLRDGLLLEQVKGLELVRRSVER